MALTKFFRRLSHVICPRGFSHFRIFASAVFIFALVTSSQKTSATDGTWKFNANGVWSDSANWNNGIIADGIGARASFSNSSSTARTVMVDTPHTVGQLTFFGSAAVSANWTLLGSNTITLDAISTAAGITSNTNVKISTPLAGNDGLAIMSSGVLELLGGNTYSGTTVISGGDLRAVDGIGLPSSSNLLFANSISTLQSRGSFTRLLGTGPAQVSWQTSGGFSAFGGPLTVRIGNSTDTLRWIETPHFLSNDEELVLNSTTANDLVDLQNGLHLPGLGAAINVLDNPFSTTDFAMISGPISGGLVKKGPGTLVLTGANTYGGTYLEAGTLQIGNGDTAGTLGTDVVRFNGGTLVFNRSDAITVPNSFSRAGLIIQDGEGSTTLSGDFYDADARIQINKGTLALDYSNNKSTKIYSNSTLTIGSATLDLKGAYPSGPPVEEFAGATSIKGTASISRSSGTTTLRLGTITFMPGTSLNISADDIATTSNASINGIIPNITVNDRLAKKKMLGFSDVIVALADADYAKIARTGGKINSDWIANTCTIRALQGEPNTPITMATPGITDINSFSNLADDGPTQVTIGEGNTLRLGTKGVILNPATAMPLSFIGGSITAGGNKNNTVGAITINNAVTTTIGSSITNNGTGAVSFTKVGIGTTYLTADNTYTGDTAVGAGTLDISGSQATGAKYWVNAGANLITNTLRASSVVTLNGTVTIRANGGETGASRFGILEIGTGAKLNLKDNDLVVGSAFDLNAVRAAIVAGKTNNAVIGITSDLPAFGVTTGFGYAFGNDAAISPLLAGSLSGQSYDADSVLVKYTFLGDADLDGDSDLNDLGLWAQSFTGDLGNPANPVTFWTSGDFDYDGDTDLNDLGFWAGTFTGDLGGGAGSLIVVVPNAPAEAVTILNTMGITVVPEPSTVSLLVFAGVGLLLRSRRKKLRNFHS